MVPFHTSVNSAWYPLSVPIAMQVVGDGHDTDASAVSAKPVGLGLVCIDHLVRVLLSASVRRVPALLVRLPTATQVFVEVHDTAPNPPPFAPAGFRESSIDQLAPFQRSTTATRLPPRLRNDPTAVHAVLDMHDTPLSPPALAPAGRRVRWTVQLAPFQRTARQPPTAVHAVLEVHETLLSERGAPRSRWNDQRVPFKRPTSIPAGGIPTPAT